MAANWAGCKQKARSVLDKYKDSTPSAIDVFGIAQNEGITITYFSPNGDTNGISGCLSDDRKTIFINKEEAPERQAYTIAHELGHYFLEHKAGDFGVLLRVAIQDSLKTDIEKEADCFAAELLMPEALIREAVKRYRLTYSDSLLLSRLFGVSQAAMKYRLANIQKNYRD